MLDPDDLPPSLANSRDAYIITTLLRTKVHRGYNPWSNRAIYQETTQRLYNKFSDGGGGDRDGVARSLQIEMSRCRELEVPTGLKNSNANAAAESWNSFRLTLINQFSTVLKWGPDWEDLLQEMLVAFNDPETGNTRLYQHFNAAFEDEHLLPHPLLHADVLIYRLDDSFAAGSSTYGRTCVSADWDRCVRRNPGEDAITLAVRLINAYLRKIDNHDVVVTAKTVWGYPSYADELNNRYAKCLLNDVADPERGEDNLHTFLSAWVKIKKRLECGEITDRGKLSCKYLAEMYVVPAETVEAYASQLIDEIENESDGSSAASSADTQQGTQPRRTSRITGRGSRSRRAQLRADRALQE